MTDHGTVILTLGILPIALAITVGAAVGSFLAARLVFRRMK
jgi:uncharacterized protein YneF (UPF0154 family)